MTVRAAVLLTAFFALASFAGVLLLNRSDTPPEPVEASPTTTTTTTGPSTTTVPPTTTTTEAPPPPPPPPKPAPKPEPQPEEAANSTQASREPLTGDCYGLRGTLAAVGLPPLFCEVVRCESGGRPWVTNGSSTGLTQLHRKYHEGRAARLGFTWDRMFEPVPNLTVAADLYREQGLTPWNPSRHCWRHAA